MTSSTQTVLITGASSGIGKELAIEFAKRHYNLVITARRQNLLTNLANELQAQYSIQVHVIACDLAQADSAKQLINILQEKNISIDILVNNAGFGDHGYFASADLTKAREMVQLNIASLMDLTHHFLAVMLGRQQVYILNVASTAGMQPTPTMAVYGATKAFVLSFTQAIATEYAGKNVHITALCPGPVITEFAERANMEKANLFNVPVMQILSPAAVARTGIKALFAGKRVCVPGWRNDLTMKFSRFTPQGIALKVTKLFMSKR